MTDVNDNSPVFKPAVYEKTIPENSEIGSTVVTVTTSDEDSGDNGNVMYRIVSGGNGLLAIDMVSNNKKKSPLQSLFNT